MRGFSFKNVLAYIAVSSIILGGTSNVFAAFNPRSINPDFMFSATDSHGKTILCAHDGANQVTPVIRSGNKNISISTKINQLKAKLKGARSTNKATLKTEIANLQRVMNQRANKCRTSFRQKKKKNFLPKETFASLESTAEATPTPRAGTTINNNVTIESVELLDTKEDHASTQGVFAAGPGFYGNLLNDFHWRLVLNSNTSTSIKAILLTADSSYVNTNSEGWTTSSARHAGKDLYPLVILKDGVQLNSKYNDTIGPISEGSTVLDLYGQIESYAFDGGTLTIDFDDNSRLTSPIAASTFALEPIKLDSLGCHDSDGGVAYNTKGDISFSVNGQSYNFSDYCIDSKIVAEGICGGYDRSARQLVLSHGVCPGSCVDGACVGGSGNAQGDFTASIVSLESGSRLGWTFKFNTGRQRSIEFIVYNSMKFQADVYLGTRKIVLGDGGEAEIFTPGDYELSILMPAGTERPTDGLMTIVFTDGTRFYAQL